MMTKAPTPCGTRKYFLIILMPYFVSDIPPNSFNVFTYDNGFD